MKVEPHNIVVGADKNIMLLNVSIDWKASNNTFAKNINELNFVDPGKHDYRLKRGSPAVNAGKDVSSYGVKADHDNKRRPQGGAYEYGSGEAVNNQKSL